MNEIKPDEAMAALAVIQRNMSAGRFPTVGGAVSLIPADQVEILFNAQQGVGTTFVPKIPDAGNRDAVTLHEWFIAAIEQALTFGDPPFSDAATSPMDQTLHTYLGKGVDWGRIHAYAVSKDPTVLPPQAPYWQADLEPTSVMAFCGVQTRARVAGNHDTAPALLDFMAADPDAAVRDAATANLHDDEPAPELTSSARTAKRSTAVWASAVTGVAVAAVVWILISIGLGNAYSYEVVDQEDRGATSSVHFTDEVDMTRTGERICSDGDNYHDCVNFHVTMFNVACARQNLSFSAKIDCDALGKFVDDVKAKDNECGFGCTVAGDDTGKWGWEILRPHPHSEMTSDNNSRPKITHTEHCVFVLGDIKLGSCEREPSDDSETTLPIS